MKNIFFAVMFMAHTWLCSASDGGIVVGTPLYPKGPELGGSLLEPLSPSFFNQSAHLFGSENGSISHVTPVVVSAAAAAAAITEPTPASACASSASSSTTSSTASSTGSQSASAGAVASNGTSSSSSSAMHTASSGTAHADSKKKGTPLSVILAQRSKAGTTGKGPQPSLSLPRRASLTPHSAGSSTRTLAPSTHQNGMSKRSGTLPAALSQKPSAAHTLFARKARNKK